MARALVCALALGLSSAQPPQDCGQFDRRVFEPITLRNKQGLELSVLPYGGTAQRLLVPTRGRQPVDVLLGFDQGDWYCSGGPMGQHPYFGALIGRVANRIARCSFSLGGSTYRLPCNEYQAATGLNDTLHGGPIGYDRRAWNVTARGPTSLTLELDSPAGEMGFPSSLHLTVVYTVTEGAPPASLGAWDLAYTIKNTGALPTPVAPTQHAYFMLGGFTGGEETVLAHTLRMANATAYEGIDAGLIPTGELIPVTQQPWMDFTAAKAVGEAFPLPSGASGYDNGWVFSGPTSGRDFAPQAELIASASGLRMVTWVSAHDVFLSPPSPPPSPLSRKMRRVPLCPQSSPSTHAHQNLADGCSGSAGVHG